MSELATSYDFSVEKGDTFHKVMTYYEGRGTYPISSVSTGSKTFTISGDYADDFTPTEKFGVIDSTGNDGDYTIVSVEYSYSADTTIITVSENVPSAVADGAIRYKEVTIPGDVVDLSGYTASMHIRKKVRNELVLALTTENGRITLGDELGTITLHVDSDTMDDISPGTYFYDLELYWNDGEDKVKKLIKGDFVVLREVTTVV